MLCLFDPRTILLCLFSVIASNSVYLPSVYPQGIDRHLSGSPCDFINYSSDTLFFRATGIGVNSDFRTAERLARLDATSNLAANISITVELVTERYFVEQYNGKSIEFSAAFKQLTRLVSRHQMSNIEIVCKQTDYDGRMFTHRVAVEVSTCDVLSKLEEDLSNDPTINHLYDKGLFDNVFVKELNTY